MMTDEELATQSPALAAISSGQTQTQLERCSPTTTATTTIGGSLARGSHSQYPIAKCK
jgi:hypothetical protein